MTKLEQKIDRHGFFLEPLSLTQGLKSMDISLAPDEPSKHLPRCVSSVDIANQILVCNVGTAGVCYVLYCSECTNNFKDFLRVYYFIG